MKKYSIDQSITSEISKHKESLVDDELLTESIEDLDEK